MEVVVVVIKTMIAEAMASKHLAILLTLLDKHLQAMPMTLTLNVSTHSP